MAFVLFAASSAARPAVAIDPDSLEFPPTLVGDYGYAMATITNTGPDDDVLIGVLPQGEPLFPTQAGTCNLQNWIIPAGTSCTYQFGFHPQRPGRVRSTLTLHFGSGATLAMSLTGRGRPH
jgi:hypothetical protein